MINGKLRLFLMAREDVAVLLWEHYEIERVLL